MSPDWWVLPTNVGISLIPAVIFALLFSLVFVDLVLISIDRQSIGHRVATWFRHYPIFYVVLTFFYGALVGHFFLVSIFKGT